MTGRTVAVVLNWRRADDTLACVASLLACDRALDIVVLDNASGDGSLAAIWAGLEASPERLAARASLTRVMPGDTWPDAEAAPRQVLVADTTRNGGYAFGNNIGISIALSRAATAWVWVLNNDTVIPGAATLDALIARMEDDPAIGLCGATVVYAHDPNRVQTLAGGRFLPRLGRCEPIGMNHDLAAPVDRDAVERDLAYVNGAASFVRRDLLETVGLMTEDYFLYYEEFDWAMRAKGRFRTGFAPDARVVHAVGAAIGTDDFGGCSPLSSYYNARNRIRFLRRFSPFSLPGALVDLAYEMWREGRLGRRTNVGAVARAVVGLPFRA